MKTFHGINELDSLKSLGLSHKEALIYLAALETGGANIADLADSAGIERTGVYYHIDRLLQLKLLKPTTRGKRTFYLPSDPDRLQRMLQHRNQEFDQIFPRLQNVFSKEASKSIFEYFEGKDEIDKFYHRVYMIFTKMKAPENTIYVLGNSYRTVMKTDEHNFIKYKIPTKQIDLITKCILPKSQKSKNDSENAMDPYIVTRYNLPRANLKYIDDKYKYPGSVVITNNRLILYDFRNLIFSITQNKNLALTWRIFFEFIWDHLPLK